MSGGSDILETLTLRSRATWATHWAWLGCRSGTPPATMYTASPRVSTWSDARLKSTNYTIAKKCT